MRTRLLALTLIAGFALTAAVAIAAQDFEKVEVTAEHVRGNVHVLFGLGGNIGVSAGDDGVFLIDDQFAPLTPKVLAALAGISDRPVGFLINTHYHGDHTGGNENLGQAGTVIVAHDELRKRLLSRPLDESGGWTAEGAGDGLPVITFNDQLSFHLNGDEARAIHVPHAHTDGDSFIHFRGSDVIHMGDLMFNGMFPFIDVDAGGNVEGVLEGYDRALALAGDETLVIPGHGPVGRRQDLESNRAMIQTVRDRVASLVAERKSLEQVLAAAPSAEYDEDYDWDFIDAKSFVTAVYRSLASATP